MSEKPPEEQFPDKENNENEGDAERELDDNQEINEYKILGGRDVALLRENNLYCDLNELIKFEDMALQNHSQTFEQMAQRGGMGLHEIYALVTNKRNFETARMDKGDIITHLCNEGILKKRE